MNVYIRRATANDQAAIRSIVREAGLNPLHLHWRNFVVAQHDSAVVGCGQLRPHREGSAELASLAVSPTCQGSGIGTEILRTLTDRTQRDVYLMCEARMRSYYRRFGFSVVSAGDLPAEMRYYFLLGGAFAWLMRTLFRHPVRIVAMRRSFGS